MTSTPQVAAVDMAIYQGLVNFVQFEAETESVILKEIHRRINIQKAIHTQCIARQELITTFFMQLGQLLYNYREQRHI